MKTTLGLVILAGAISGHAVAAGPLETVLAIGGEGSGNAEATEAWQSLAAGGPDSLIGLLGAIDGASPIAANYLRTAARSVADRAQAGDVLPVAELEAFLGDRNHGANARWMAYALIEAAEPEMAERLVEGFADDPSPALRRLAVARMIEGAGGDDVPKLKAALAAAREVDQVTKIAKSLEEAGEKVDLPRQFGFLMRWKATGPFDNTAREGFDTKFPPEEGAVDLGSSYEGKDGAATWQDMVSADDFGMVDFNKLYTPLKEVTGYGFTTFESAEARAAELRLGCKNAFKIWLNGELVFARDEYHRGMRIDQYVMPVQLEAGANTLLIKLCQNEQEEDWTVQWQFQLRVCDAAGAAILSEDRKPTPTAEEATGAPTRRRRPAN